MEEDSEKALNNILNHNYKNFLQPLNLKFKKKENHFMQFEILNRIIVNIEFTNSWVVYVQGHKYPYDFENLIKSEISSNDDIITIFVKVCNYIMLLVDVQFQQPLVFECPPNFRPKPKFHLTELFKQGQAFQEIISKNNLKSLVQFNLNEKKLGCQISIKAGLLNLTDDDLHLLGLSPGSVLSLRISIKDQRLNQYLDEKNLIWWNFMSMENIHYAILIDGNNIVTENLAFLHSLIQLYFLIFKAYSKDPIKNKLSYNHVFWALIFEAFSFGHKTTEPLFSQFQNQIIQICDSLKGPPEMKNIVNILLQNLAFSSTNVLEILLNLMKFALESFSLFCTICGKIVDNNNKRKITCNDYNCIIRLEETCNADLYFEINSSPELARFEFNIALAAILSPEVRDLFQPFPSFYLNKDILKLDNQSQLLQRNNFVLIKQGNINSKPDHSNKNIDLLYYDIMSLPLLDDLYKAKNDYELRNIIRSKSQNFDESSARISLLQYLITTDKNKLVMLQNEDAPFGAIPNFLQILMIPPNSKENKEFLLMKQQHGSQFLFHGTGNSSTYSILRNGVVVLSGTYLMKVGQSYGPGIYCGMDFNTSARYITEFAKSALPTQINVNGQSINFQIPPNLFKPYNIIFVFECINNGVKLYGGIAVVAHHRFLSPRYIFAWEKNIVAPNQNIPLATLQNHYYQTLNKISVKDQELINTRIKKLS